MADAALGRQPSLHWLQHIAGPAALCDADGRIASANESLLDLCGLPVDQVRSRTLETLFDLALCAGEARPPPGQDEAWGARVVGRQGDGTPFVANLAVVPSRDGLELWLLSDFSVDDTARLQRAASHRMAALGRLAAGVAHEINNPLICLLGDISVASEELERMVVAGGASGPELQRLADMLAEAKQEALRIRGRSRELSAFSGTDGHALPLDPRSVMESVLSLAHNEIRHRAILETSYEDRLPKVWAHAKRLTHALLNLVLYLLDRKDGSGGRRGTLAVSVARTPAGESAEPTVTIELWEVGAQAEEDAGRLFDPFRAGGGVPGGGLALSVSRGLISEMGGAVEAATGPRGAGFRVALPQVQLKRGRKRARILIIDDEAPVGRTLRRLLREHEVVYCQGGDAALTELASRPFDIVFCDVMMPDLSGFELYERVRDEQPGAEQAFVFITGGAFTPQARTYLQRVPNRTIEKPFVAEEIGRIVKEMLTVG